MTELYTVAFAGNAAAILDEKAARSASSVAAALLEDDAVAATLGVLTAGGFNELPGFAVIECNLAGAARIVVRPPFTLTVTTEGGVQTIGGDEVATWSERSFGLVEAIKVSSGGRVIGDVRAVGGRLIAVFSTGSDGLDTHLTTTPDLEVVAAAGAPQSVEELERTEPADVHAAGFGHDDDLDPDDTHLREPAPTAPVEPEVASPPPGAPAVTPPPSGGLIAGMPNFDGPAAPDPGDSFDTGDHDDFTAIRPKVSPALVTGTPLTRAPVAIPGTVQAVHCRAGHSNPMHATSCRMCGSAIEDRTTTDVARPSLGRLRVSTGQVVDLTLSVVIGRSPTASGTRPDQPFQFVTVPSPDKLVSRSHVEIRVDGWSVQVLDLKSRNGTTVIRPGDAPVLLMAPHAPFPVEVGTTIDLGGGTSMVIEIPAS